MMRSIGVCLLNKCLAEVAMRPTTYYYIISKQREHKSELSLQAVFCEPTGSSCNIWYIESSPDNSFIGVNIAAFTEPRDQTPPDG